MELKIIDNIINELRENKEEFKDFELNSKFRNFEEKSEFEHLYDKPECYDMQPSSNHPERFPLDCKYLRYLCAWTCIKGDYPYKECPFCENCKYSFTI